MSDTFLKWAGGKRWFVNNESYRLPVEYNRYIEPFLGGGAVFFYLSPAEAILSDINQELITTYQAIRDDVDGVYRNLRSHQRNNSREYYYRVRATKPRTLSTIAARMIYLNKTCFNGIYRVNRKGDFNVPYGTDRLLTFDRQKLVRSSEILQNAELFCQDFEQTIDMSEEDDFLFCDPPYAVLDEDNRFVGYTADIFSWNDQIRLANSLIRAKNRGVKIIMTNVSHPAVLGLYENQQGFHIETTERTCLIAAATQVRRNYNELIVSANID